MLHIESKGPSSRPAHWRDRPGVLFHYPADLDLLLNEKHLAGHPWC